MSRSSEFRHLGPFFLPLRPLKIEDRPSPGLIPQTFLSRHTSTETGQVHHGVVNEDIAEDRTERGHGLGSARDLRLACVLARLFGKCSLGRPSRVPPAR